MAQTKNYMAQTKNYLVLLELRFSALYFEAKIENRFKILADRISRFYLFEMKHQIKLSNTNVIIVNFLNKDIVSDREIQFGFGSKKSDWIGIINFPLSQDELESLNDDGKRKFVLETLYKILIRFCENENESTKLLEDAYNRILISDFYAPYSKPIHSSKIRISGYIESRQNWGNADYRLAIKNNETGEIKTYYIVRKDHTFFDEIPSITQQDVLSYPQIFNPIKWEGKNFVMYWGQEKYVFDSGKEQLLKEI